MINKYIGHSSQCSGVEEHRLVGGKGDGMRLLEVRNGQGLHFTVSVDRAADISRLFFKGDNFAYISPSGYVAPAYYDDKEAGFLKSFTAGFLTTCGINAVGSPCEDNGQKLSLHGTVSNTPAEQVYHTQNDEQIEIHAVINLMGIFAEKLMMHRTIICSKRENVIRIVDRIENRGDRVDPLMILYHMNIGYPLLSEHAELIIPSDHIAARNVNAEHDIERWNQILEPQRNFEEQCYYHRFDNNIGLATIYNPSIQKGLYIAFDTSTLNYFTEWKMLGYKDYVLGLEPGNCHPDGRDVMRKDNTLKFINPGETMTYQVEIGMIEGHEAWEIKKGEIKC
ncbi:aldose 1-epimerase family protein [Paenibacillus graminis]|uniref:aldose 1-epimerase family protein n=1 Tax=Paenibacillus graminis TaxID=189425 RepID=UPI000472CA12|nr:aldose 1-epimerase family protein [Paenibacillus graminis]